MESIDFRVIIAMLGVMGWGCFMRENDTKVIASMQRESPVYKGFQRFSALEVIRFFAMFSDFSFDGSSTYWQGCQTI